MSSFIGYLLSGYVFLFIETFWKSIQFKSPCKKPVSVHSVEVRFQARNSCGSNSAAVFIVKKIATKRVLNQNVSAEKEMSFNIKKLPKTRNYFCEFSCLFFCAQRCYNQGNYYKRNSFQKEMILCRIKI